MPWYKNKIECTPRISVCDFYPRFLFPKGKESCLLNTLKSRAGDWNRVEWTGSRYTLPFSIKHTSPLSSLALNTEQVFMVKAWIAVVGLMTIFASTPPNEIGAL